MLHQLCLLLACTCILPTVARAAMNMNMNLMRLSDRHFHSRMRSLLGKLSELSSTPPNPCNILTSTTVYIRVSHALWIIMKQWPPKRSTDKSYKIDTPQLLRYLPTVPLILQPSSSGLIPFPARFATRQLLLFMSAAGPVYSTVS